MIQTLRSLFTKPAPGRRVSLRINLALLVLVCVVPAIAVCAYLAYTNYQLKRDAVYRSTEIITLQVLSALDRELAGIESGLKVLATSDALARNDLPQFYQQARDALKSQVVYNYILTDREGRQVLNTLRPLGSPLPATGTPAALAQVFVSGKTALTDLFIGPVTKLPAVAMGVPIFSEDGQVRYSLNIGLDPQRLSALVQKQALPEGWLVAVVDSSGTIVGRSRDAQKYVGMPAVDSLRTVLQQKDAGTLETMSKDGVRVVSAFAHSSTWGWAVVTGAPQAQLEADVTKTFAGLLLAVGISLAIGSVVAYLLSRQVLSTLQFLNRAALSLREGKPLDLPPVQFREAEAVGEAMVQASLLMADVHHRAYHDALTNLGNRELFNALARRQIAESTRSGKPMALLSLDLDHFKEVNDSQGHGVGDVLLKEVAARISSTIRASDAAARMGGDEFSVLLSDADEPVAIDIATRLVAALAQPYEGVYKRISASIGIAVYPEAGTELKDLMESADRALYAVKGGGRNGYAVAGPGGSTGAPKVAAGAAIRPPAPSSSAS